MYRFAICAIFVAACLASFPILAEETAGLHVCVGVMAGAGNQVSGKVARDSLIKALKKQKKPPLTLVPLESLPEDQLTEAKQKTCEYLLTTDLVEEHTEQGYLPGVGAYAGSVPIFFVTTSYKLGKISDGTEVTKGSMKAQDTGSPQNAVEFTMSKIAGKVDGALKGAK